MKRINYVLGFLVIISILFLVSCSNTTNVNTIPEDKLCSVDSDCVAASCCHATQAVNSKFAPDCKEMLCTMNCAPDTLDCGQGEIKCVKNECTPVMN